jgi:hypothetical protein
VEHASRPSICDGEAIDLLCEDVKRDLIRVIDREVKDFRRRSESDHETEAHREFAKDRCRHFVGRTDLLGKISDYIHANERYQPLIIHGKSGSGKTALMAKVALNWLSPTNEDPKSNVVFRFIGATPGSSNLRSLLTDLCRQLGIENPPQDTNELVSAFRSRLSPPEQMNSEQLSDESGEAGPVQNTIVFLDALDQLNPTNNARMLYWLPRKLAPGVKFVMSVLETEQDRDHEKSDDDPFDLAQRIWPESLEELGELGAKEGETLLNMWLTEVGRVLQSDQRQDVLGNFNACGNPLYLKLAFDEARRWTSWEGLPCGSDDVPGLNKDVPGILEDLFWRLELPEHHGRILVERALRYIAAAKNGLTEDELIDILSADKDVMADFFRRSPQSPKVDRLPVVIWSRLLVDIEPYMTVRRADGTMVMDFYHRQVGEAVDRRYLADYERLKAHQHLAEYFHELDYWAESLESQRARARRLPPTPRPANVRKVVELPFHRIEAAKLGGKDDPKSPLWDVIADLLTDWQFLEAKAEADPNFREQESEEPKSVTGEVES